MRGIKLKVDCTIIQSYSGTMWHYMIGTLLRSKQYQNKQNSIQSWFILDLSTENAMCLKRKFQDGAQDGRQIEWCYKSSAAPYIS